MKIYLLPGSDSTLWHTIVRGIAAVIVTFVVSILLPNTGNIGEEEQRFAE